MPVEIKELVIKLKVEESRNTSNAPVDRKALQAEIAIQVKREVQKQLKKIDER